jgi:cytochrome c peroxidase
VKTWALLTAVLVAAGLAACGSTGGGASSGDSVDAGPASGDAATDSAVSPVPVVVVEGDYSWNIPAGFRKPVVPADNPMSKAKVDLGRHLFYDKRLSENRTQSCGSCHEQKRAFTDGKARGVGSTGQMHPRGSMALGNVGFATTLTWANDLIDSLEEQALLPLFGETPVELGFANREDELLRRLREDASYPGKFAASFPGEADPVSVKNITKALACFERTLISGNSAYDRFVFGIDSTALSESAQRGKELFFSEKLECFHCHGGFAFADSVTHEGKTIIETAFHNTGLYNLDGLGAYPADNKGLMDVSGKPQDMGRFRAPSLRNIALTAPYMHDGTIATLEEVLDTYARGGRLITSGPNAGDGAKSPLRSEFVRGFTLSTDERADVVAFLKSLTDDAFLGNPAHADPFPASP